MSKKKGFKFVQKEITRERLQKAVPFVNSEGHPVTASDLFGMYIGEKKLNPLYSQNNELTQEFLNKYFKITLKTFDQIARENMFSKKECWEELLKTKEMKEVEEQEIIDLGQDVLRGEAVPTAEQSKQIMVKYKRCPLCEGLLRLAGHPLSEEMNKAHEELIRLCA